MHPGPTDPAADARRIWQAAVDAVMPATLVRNALRVEDDELVLPQAKLRIPLGDVRRIAVVGAGKAGAGMAAAVEDALEDVLESRDVHGAVSVPDATVRPLARLQLVPARASHDNNATEAGAAGARKIRDVASHAGPKDLLLCLLSGGGSALLPAPCEGITLEDKRHVVALLQARGADIAEVNCVRKHLSDLKGGGLVRATKAGRIVTLAISDVMGDPLDVIASGPTFTDPTTYADALAVLAKHGLDGKDAPKSVLQVLREGRDGKRAETLKELPPHVVNVVIGNSATAVRAAKRAAEVLGYEAHASESEVGGSTESVARLIAAFIELTRKKAAKRGAHRRVCLISGGETTVDLGDSPGEGGRNQELVLHVLSLLGTRRMAGLAVLSGGTDGEDGPTDAAGAVADIDVARKAARLGLRPRAYLSLHDSYRFFAKAGGHLKTGFTGTNVMDLRIACFDTAVEPPASSSVG